MMFLHENITCRLKFRNEYRYFGTQISNIFYLIQNSNTFRKIQKWCHVYGDENPRCRSQLINLTNEPHSVLGRTFISAIGHQNRINIDEDSISFFIQALKKTVSAAHAPSLLKDQLQCSLVRATYFESFAQTAQKPEQTIVQCTNSSNKTLLDWFASIFRNLGFPSAEYGSITYVFECKTYRTRQISSLVTSRDFLKTVQQSWRTSSPKSVGFRKIH